MFGQIKTKLNKKRGKMYFETANPGVIVGTGFETKLPQYIRCGNNVIIGDNSRLLCWDSYNGEKFENKPEILIGDNFNATRNLTIQCAKRVSIGNNVLIASDVFIIDYNHGMSPLTPNYLENPLELSNGIVIKDGVWIGNNVVILPGVTIGEKAIVGAGAIVSRDIPPYSIAAGIPACVIKKYDKVSEKWVKFI